MSWRGQQRVYFAAACGKVKIGCSSDTEARIGSIGEWIPFPITLMAEMPGSYALESSIHRMFDDEWSHGEWFILSPRLLEFIARVAAGEPVVIDMAVHGVRRRAFIADKKRIRHRLTRLRNAGSDLPGEMSAQLRAVRKGQPIPPALLSEINAFIDEALAYLQSTERTVRQAAA